MGKAASREQHELWGGRGAVGLARALSLLQSVPIAEATLAATFARRG